VYVDSNPNNDKVISKSGNIYYGGEHTYYGKTQKNSSTVSGYACPSGTYKVGMSFSNGATSWCLPR
jgi:streptogramin lyase